MSDTGNSITLRVGDYVRTDRVADGATYRPYVALCDVVAGQMVHEGQIARPNSGRARYWAHRYRFRNRPNRARRRRVYNRLTSDILRMYFEPAPVKRIHS